VWSLLCGGSKEAFGSMRARVREDRAMAAVRRCVWMGADGGRDVAIDIVGKRCGNGAERASGEEEKSKWRDSLSCCLALAHSLSLLVSLTHTIKRGTTTRALLPDSIQPPPSTHRHRQSLKRGLGVLCRQQAMSNTSHLLSRRGGAGVGPGLRLRAPAARKAMVARASTAQDGRMDLFSPSKVRILQRVERRALSTPLPLSLSSPANPHSPNDDDHPNHRSTSSCASSAAARTATTTSPRSST